LVDLSGGLFSTTKTTVTFHKKHSATRRTAAYRARLRALIDIIRDRAHTF
jgi:hypothetical protein